MSFTGSVQNGVVVLDAPGALPDGTAVEVSVRVGHELLTHYELFRDIIGVAVGLPADLAGNHTRTLWDRLGADVGQADGSPPDASDRIDHYVVFGVSAD